ncbi:T3P18.3 [Cucumis melo var. makuwa]|uniref:T3P18.3 n=1 Tax=Cucumis melo var. makuwa TaxID=1194695 RepID=A0A5D3DHC7_CUCMM|nr:T3P18.3 [Cucumis melo var. makuwa]
MANTSLNVSPPVTVVFTTPPLNQLLNQFPSTKLDRTNYLLWKTIALPILKTVGESTETVSVKASSAVSEGTTASSSTSMDSKIVNPKYEKWVTSDLLLLGWIYNSMVSDMALQLMEFNTGKDLWEAIKNLFGIQSRQKKIFFVTSSKLLRKVSLGLYKVYNPVTAVIQGKPDIFLLDMQSELLIFEKHLEHQNSQRNPGNENVVVGNGNKLQISCVGYASLADGKNCLRLDNILCVPEVKKNMAKDTGGVLLKGTLSDGLYHLEGVAVKSVGELEHSDSSKKQFEHINNASILVLSEKVSSSIGASKTVWRRRLGHPSMKILNSLLKECNLVVNDNEEPKLCESC